MKSKRIMMKTNPASSVTLSRVIMWVAQATLTALFILIYTAQQELKVQVASLYATQAAKDSQFARTETKATITDENIKEIRGDIKLINSAIQDLRILVQGRRN